MSAPGYAEAFDTVEDAIKEIAVGRPIVVTDDENRENEGDLIFAAEKATPELVNMMIRNGGGLICVPTVAEQLNRLGLSPMAQVNRESHGTAFTVSVDAAEGVTTGISAHDRAKAIKILADPNARPEQLVQPGHVFPLHARSGGVLERAGHTEAAVDQAKLAGLQPAGVLCEILNEDGSCARLPQLVEYKKRFGLKLISIASLIEYRHRRECLVEDIYQEPFSSAFGEFTLHVFRSRLDGAFHYALTMGQLGPEPTLVRVHSENVLTDLFAEKDNHNSGVFQKALRRIAQDGRGVAVYMSNPCGGVNLPPSLQPKDSSCGGFPSRGVDFRAYGIGAQILTSFGLSKVRLLTNSTRRVVALDGYGLEIVEQIGLD